MKKLFAAALVAVLFTLPSVSAFSQLRKVPAEVTDAFAQKYPGATGVEWKDKLSGFTASFNSDNTAYVAAFNNKGTRESTEQQIEQDAVPQPVSDGYTKSKYADWEILKVHKIELPGDEWQYRLQIGKGDIKKRNLLFNSSGRLLKDGLTI